MTAPTIQPTAIHKPPKIIHARLSNSDRADMPFSADCKSREGYRRAGQCLPALVEPHGTAQMELRNHQPARRSRRDNEAHCGRCAWRPVATDDSPPWELPTVEPRQVSRTA